MQIAISKKELYTMIKTAVREVLQEDKSNKTNKSWSIGFIDSTYVCLKNDPIQRPTQGDYPVREKLL